MKGMLKNPLPADIPLEVRINGLVGWLDITYLWGFCPGYNPRILTLYKLPGTSKYLYQLLFKKTGSLSRSRR